MLAIQIKIGDCLRAFARFDCPETLSGQYDFIVDTGELRPHLDYDVFHNKRTALHFLRRLDPDSRKVAEIVQVRGIRQPLVGAL